MHVPVTYVSNWWVIPIPSVAKVISNISAAPLLGVRVINCSWSTGSNLLLQVFLNEVYSYFVLACKIATERGTVIVASAGNDANENPDFPWVFLRDIGIKGLIIVGGVDNYENIADYYKKG